MRKLSMHILLLMLLSGLIVSCSDDNDESKDNNDDKNTEINDSLMNQVSEEDIMRGKEVYINNCQTCHQEDGMGVEGAFPALDSIKSEVNIVVNGVEGTTMIAFKDEMTDKEIVDVINFVNNSWSNNFGKTTLKDVAEVK